MKNKFDNQLDEIEIEKLEHEKSLKKLERFEEDMHYHIQNTNQTLSQISEGFQGDEAKKIYSNKEESMQLMFTETTQQAEETRSDHQKEIRILNRMEDEVIEKKRKEENKDDI